MRKGVEEYLESQGCRIVRPPAESTPLTLEGLVDGFLVHVLHLDPESYRRAFWHEAYHNGHTIGHVPRTFEGFFRRNARTFEQKVSLFLALTALFGVYTVVTLLYRRLSLVLCRLRRPTYYERERERRRKLAAERREIRKHRTLNPCPTFDAIRAALHVARKSPDLFEKYSTIMRYKAMAKRFRQACGTGEPVPPAMFLPASEVAGTEGWQQAGLVHAREVAREILGECGKTLISFEVALALRLDPDCIPVKGGVYMRKPGHPRIPKRVIGWLLRRRVA